MIRIRMDMTLNWGRGRKPWRGIEPIINGMMIPRTHRRIALTAAQCALAALVIALAGCSAEGTATPPPGTLAPPTATALPNGLTDERAVVEGICFESAFDAAGRVFVLRSAAELAWLFNSSDASGLCRRPAARGNFDFGGANGEPERALAGVWSKGVGCTADHVIEGIDIDDTARTYTVLLRLEIGGDCPYELVRPFWIGITGYNGYDIRLRVDS
jgi:hypothetical protein